MWPVEGAPNIYNALILMIIIFSGLWIRLWKTRGIKCGIKGAGCPARLGGSWNSVGDLILILIKTTGYIVPGVVPGTQDGNCYSQPGRSYGLCITWYGTV
jgi:hypothetical protein